MVALYAVVTLVAWSLSYIGVRHARRGDVPDWHALLWPVRRLAHVLPQRRTPFASAAHAQEWSEWRHTAGTLPIMTGVVLPWVLLPLLFAKIDNVAGTGEALLSLLGALAVPVLLAGAAGWLGDRKGVV